MHLAASGVAFNTWCLQREQNCIRPAGGMDALKGSRKLLSGSGFPVRSINDSNWDLFTAAGVYWTGLPRCCEIAFGFSHWIEMLGFLFFVSILFPVFSDYRSIYPLSFRSFFVRHCSPVLCQAVASVWSAGSWRRPPPRERGSARCSSIRTNTCWKDRWVQRPGRTCCSSRLRSRQTGSTERRKTESVNDAQTTWPAGMFFIRNPIWCLCAHHCVYQSAVIHLVSGAAQKKLSKIF